MLRARMALAVMLVLFTSGFTHRAVARAPHTIVKHFTPADRVSGRYQYVPFDVPAGTTTLRVSYDYNRSNAENVVDFGVFEPGSLDLGTPAFRGYSGGAKPGFVITPREATPGYRPGPLPAGTWNLLLGLYKVRESGVDVTMTIDVESRRQDRLPDSVTGTGGGGLIRRANWFLGALHTHTLHSDGAMSPPALLEQFGTAGFDFVVVTDHNNTTHSYEQVWPAPIRRPLWIIGEEVTTPAGHASVWGLRPGDWIDFRVGKGDPRIRDLVKAAHNRGALFSINHPVSECVGCGWEHEIVDDIDGIEISNGRHGEVDNALAIWDKLLISGRRITAVGSSDWHGPPNPIDDAHVRVFAASLEQQAILDAIKNGRVIVMRDARAPTPDVIVRAGNNTARVGDALDISSASQLALDVTAPNASGGRLVIVSNGERAAPLALDDKGRVHATPRALPGYVRFELYAADGSIAALTNPVYLVRP